MPDRRSQHNIVALRNRWVILVALAGLVLFAAVAFFLAVLLKKFTGLSAALAACAGVLGFLAWCTRYRVFTLTTADVAQMLDARCPELEESSELLLLPAHQLSGLPLLQQQIAASRLSGLRDPLSIRRQLRIPFVIAAVCVAAACCTQLFFDVRQAVTPALPRQTQRAQLAAAGISRALVTIIPPAYTGKPARTQSDLNIRAEAGSAITWNIRTSRRVPLAGLLVNGSPAGKFHAVSAGGADWELKRPADSPALYQIVIDTLMSPVCTLAIIADQAPAVQLVSPQQYSSIEPGMPESFIVKTILSDDYGLASAVLNMTVASGSGEAIKFTITQSTLRGFSAGGKSYRLQQPVSTRALHMQSGDQLFFYVQATDNHGQQARTDTYIVDLPDTAELMRIEGLGNPLDLKPEFFRSERQIIIETEQLLRNRDTLSTAVFKERSNNLGIDQKLLRQRYGKFLGDETDTGEPADEGLSDLSNFSNAGMLKDAYTDKHDNAEDASFYSSDTKARLKATLNQMWEAEIRLRTFAPREALPFAYKALRLLKDLQQQSRAYVAKTSHATTPLDLKKRLTGDLSKIPQAALREQQIEAPDPLLPVRLSMTVLEEPGDFSKTGLTRLGILQLAALQLDKKARTDPEKFRSAVEALRGVINLINAGRPVPPRLAVAAQQGLQELLPLPYRVPGAVSASPATMGDRYFDNLLKQQP